ncbi:MAG: hypothetical protein CML24_02090 [Rhizobiales bacterium]|nr:hypothetical protein [Hyphomicrobiales bacterium]|tara:strand:+ start:3980 stop:4171 length:192 start_codon:yes stop_codon:yes gene_type:complete
MVRFKTRLDGRSPDDIKLRAEEAWQMFELGFHFSIYGENGEYRLSIPYEIVREIGSDRIVFQQ